MIRIFLPLIMALVAFFGPWAEGSTGADFADRTVDCVLDTRLTLEACAPEGALGEQLIAYTVIGGSLAAVLSILGLLPLIGRLTSLVVIASGAVGIGAVAMLVVNALGADGIAMVGWGAWGTLAAAVVTAIVGLQGMSGERE